MKVLLINRKPRKSGNFSIESYFRAVYAVIRHKVDCVYFVSSTESNNIIPRYKAIREVKSLKADVYHITGDVHFLALGTPPDKTLLTIHDCGFMHEKNTLKRWFLWLFWLKIPVKRAKLVTCVSDTTKTEIIRYTHCDPARIRVIPTTVLDHFARVDKAFNEKKPVILHIGTKPNKNLPRLVMALKGINCKLIVVGGLDKRIKRLLKENMIDYENFVDISNEELYEHYVNTDIVAFASTFEGFGMPIIEGQKIGRPVITANCSSMPEVAGGAAHLVDPCNVSSIREGILRLILDSEYRNSLVEKGFINATRFNTETVARQYIELYKEIH